MSADPLAALRDRFLDRCARELEEIEEIAAQGDFASTRLRQLAHGLAGASGTFGFPAIGEPAARVDMAFAEELPVDPQDVRDLITRLSRALAARAR